MIRIVARLIARVFVGPALCRDESYLDISITYTVNCLRVSRILAWCPQPLRPLVKFFIPGYISLRKQEARMRRLLAPVIRDRLQASYDKGSKPVDLLQWFMDGSVGRPGDEYFIAIAQINASLAAIHSTAIVATNAIFDATTKPQYADALRDELLTLGADVNEGRYDTRLLGLTKVSRQYLRLSCLVDTNGCQSWTLF